VVWKVNEISVIERRQIRVVNKELAREVSLWALNSSCSSKEFLEKVKDTNIVLKNEVYKQIDQRRFERKLFKVLVTSDGNLANDLTIKYWKEVLKENERLRFSQMSRQAFELLGKVYKYNEYEKRDGSLVTKVREGDVIIADEKSVNKELMKHLMSIQRDPDRGLYEDQPLIPFPMLGSSTVDEMREMLGIITTHKALTGDLISDVLLSVENIERTCEIFKDFWNAIPIDELHFRNRLVALNKKHPDIPRRDQFRPIIISSLLIKVLEARLVKPLRDYMTHHLHSSQVGFVPEMDIFVNLSRLFHYTHKRRERRLRSFLLFLDFSSAYNTVLHEKLKLFDLLSEKSVLTSLEVQLSKAIYSRNTIELGEESFKPNVGVAQGSIVSPYLFNVYAEDMLLGLEKEGWRGDDLYGYADDHLVVSGSIIQLKRAIEIVVR